MFEPFTTTFTFRKQMIDHRGDRWQLASIRKIGTLAVFGGNRGREDRNLGNLNGVQITYGPKEFEFFGVVIGTATCVSHSRNKLLQGRLCVRAVSFAIMAVCARSRALVLWQTKVKSEGEISRGRSTSAIAISNLYMGQFAPKPLKI